MSVRAHAEPKPVNGYSAADDLERDRRIAGTASTVQKFTLSVSNGAETRARTRSCDERRRTAASPSAGVLPWKEASVKSRFWRRS